MITILHLLLGPAAVVSAASFLLFLVLPFTSVDSTSIKMDYLPIGNARVDPIISSTCPSDHVHTFYGPQIGVDPRRRDGKTIWDDLMNSPDDVNTGNVVENKSLYWHPTVYKYDRATNTYTADVMGQTSAYYVWESGYTKAFPAGFRMIAGFDPEKSGAMAECVNETPCDDSVQDCYSENTFFPTSRCEELEVSMTMPNCWDGINLGDQPPHTQHVEYALDEWFDAECPDSHPVKIPQIRLFFRIFDYDGGWHTFSDGSSVYHTDYVSGWNETFLQNVLDNCVNDGEGAMPMHFCQDYLTYRDEPKCDDEETCDFADPVLLQKLKAIQPAEPLDIRGTIIDEETDVVVGNLPRGGDCTNGELVDNSVDEDPVVTTPSPTPSPTTAQPVVVATPTPSPTTAQPEDTCVDATDNFNFINKKGTKTYTNKSCSWVAKKWKKHCKKLRLESDPSQKPKHVCPMACGVCVPANLVCSEFNNNKKKCKRNAGCTFNKIDGTCANRN